MKEADGFTINIILILLVIFIFIIVLGPFAVKNWMDTFDNPSPLTGYLRGNKQHVIIDFNNEIRHYIIDMSNDTVIRKEETSFTTEGEDND
jgi:hypothetical protein